MGFPDTFAIPVSDTQAYRQFGNSVVVPVIRELARIMTPHLIPVKDSQQLKIPLKIYPETEREIKISATNA